MAVSVTKIAFGTCTINASFLIHRILPLTDYKLDNPTADVAGNQHWGHATSKDLYTWENQKIAIFPRNENEQIFSGSAVVDSNNTSSFFPNQNNGVVAIYTLNTPTEQQQEIAFSIDAGYSFTRYSQTPVLTANSTQFRDPYVIRYQDHWVMVVSHARAFVISIFTSPDLRTWTFASNFSHHGLLGLPYECPNLVPMPVAGGSGDENMYVLAISINAGAPLGGSITQYFPSSFNGTHFTPVDGAARIADFGKDYAGQFFNGAGDEEGQVSIAWSSNWQYSQVVPTGELEGWRSTMSLPRKMHLANVTRIGWDIVNSPYNLPSIYDTQLANKQDIGNSSVMLDYSSISSGAVYFQANVSGLPNNTIAQGTLNFTFSSSSTKESISGGFFFSGDNAFWLSQRRIFGWADTNPFYTDRFSVANPVNEDGTFVLEGMIDRSILEVFLDGGRNTATMTFYPEGVLDKMEIRAGD